MARAKPAQVVVAPQPQPAVRTAAPAPPATEAATAAPTDALTITRFLAAALVPLVALPMFMMAHGALDQQAPDEARARTLYTTATVVGGASLLVLVGLAMPRRGWPALLAIPAAIVLGLWLADISASYGPYRCDTGFLDPGDCAHPGAIGSEVTWAILLFAAPAAILAGVLAARKRVADASVAALGGGIALAGGLTLAAATLLADLPAQVEKATAANAKVETPGLALAVLALALVSLAWLRRR